MTNAVQHPNYCTSGAGGAGASSTTGAAGVAAGASTAAGAATPHAPLAQPLTVPQLLPQAGAASQQLAAGAEQVGADLQDFTLTVLHLTGLHLAGLQQLL